MVKEKRRRREWEAIDLKSVGGSVQLGRMDRAILQTGWTICHYCFLRPSCNVCVYVSIIP